MEIYKPKKEEFKRNERSVSLNDIESKSTSQYLDMDLDGYEMQSYDLREESFKKNIFYRRQT